MLKVKVIAMGKSKESWLKEAISEYEKRLSPYLQFLWIYPKDEEQFDHFLNEGPYIALDPNGEEFDSIRFSQKLSSALEKNKSQITFAIGGPTGFTQNQLQKAYSKISLSRLTFTHQIVRLILVEQVYRALEISKKSPYHK